MWNDDGPVDYTRANAQFMNAESREMERERPETPYNFFRMTVYAHRKVLGDQAKFNESVKALASEGVEIVIGMPPLTGAERWQRYDSPDGDFYLSEIESAAMMQARADMAAFQKYFREHGLYREVKP